MKHTPHAPQHLHPAAMALGLALAVLIGTPVQAQGVFRVVGPDGKVTFTDRPPSAPTGTGANASDPAAAPDASPTGLPYALRQAMSRFPVLLYTGTDCKACDAGRKLLNTQGVPYAEKTVTTQADADAFKAINGAQTVPYLTIGQQGVKGYNEGEWQRYLSAAGYPAKSALPAGYKNPAPVPLVPVAATATATPSTAGGAAAAAPQAPAVTPVAPRNTNAAGIRF